MHPTKDPMGAAIADYWKHGKAGRLRVFSPDFDEDEIPVETLFRTFDEMPVLERQALDMASGRTLDVGAGAGCHSLALQQKGVQVRAIDISPLAVATMKERGVQDVCEQDLWTVTQRFDTILMLMNGIGIVGSLEELPRFFCHIDHILAEGGQLLCDSSDLSYLFDPDDEALTQPPYYGELQYQMQYKRIKGEAFPWLYVDFDTLCQAAESHGFKAERLLQGEHYDYLARITRQEYNTSARI